MRLALATALAFVTVAGCKRGEETGRVGGVTDTVVTSRQTQDTTIVTRDTTVKVDTTVKHGDKAVRTDTVKKSSGSTRPSGVDSTKK